MYYTHIKQNFIEVILQQDQLPQTVQQCCNERWQL